MREELGGLNLLRQLEPVRALIVFLALSLVGACVPQVSSLEQPTFRAVPESVRLVRLDPPGIGSGTALFRLELDASNPNAFALTLSDLDFDLFLGDRPVARGSSGGVSLPPNGSERLTLEVTVDLEETPELLGDLTRLVTGEPLRYRLEGAATAEAFGLQRRFSAVTLAAGTVEPVSLAAPSFRYLPEVSGLREVSLDRVVVAVGIELSNPTPLGYLFSAPALELNLGGRRVAETRVAAQPLPAFSSARLNVQFEFRPATAGTALVQGLTNLNGGGSLDLDLSGCFSLELPGVTKRDFSVERLLEGVLR